MQRKPKAMAIPDLVHGRQGMYCPEFCGVRWNGKGRRRARRVMGRYIQHYMRRHVNVDE